MFKIAVVTGDLGNLYELAFALRTEVYDQDQGLVLFNCNLVDESQVEFVAPLYELEVASVVPATSYIFLMKVVKGGGLEVAHDIPTQGFARPCPIPLVYKRFQDGPGGPWVLLVKTDDFNRYGFYKAKELPYKYDEDGGLRVIFDYEGFLEPCDLPYRPIEGGIEVIYNAGEAPGFYPPAHIQLCYEEIEGGIQVVSYRYKKLGFAPAWPIK